MINEKYYKALISVISFTLSLLICSCVLITNKQLENIEAPEPPGTATPTQPHLEDKDLPSATPTAGDEWVSYEDRRANFRLYHPALWSPEETPDLDRIYLGDQIIITYGGDNRYWVNCGGDCPIVQTETNTNIAGQPAKKLSGYIGSVGGYVPQEYITYIIEHQGGYLILTLYAVGLEAEADQVDSIRPLDPEDVAVFERIMATLEIKVSPEPPASPSLTPMPSTPTATNSPVPPTKTPNMPSNEINFRSGGTSAFIQGPISSRKAHAYSLRARRGQTLIVTVTSPGNDVYLDIKSLEDGATYIRDIDGSSYWSGELPKTQAYEITLSTDNPDTYYLLSVEIPVNIIFQAGAVSATIDGYIQTNSELHPGIMTRVRHLLYASAGQSLAVKLTSPNIEDLSLGLYGQQNGQPYARFHVKSDGFEKVLPTTQGYYLDVVSVSGTSTSFQLEVTIE